MLEDVTVEVPASEQDGEREARRARRARLLLGLAALVTVFVLGQVLLASNQAAEHAWADLCWTFVSLWAGMRCLSTSQTRTLRHHRRAWAWIAIGCFLWGGGMLIWDVYELVLGVVTPFPTLAEVGFLGLVPCWMMALFGFRSDEPTRSLTVRQLGDLGTVLAVLTMVCSLALYVPATERSQAPAYLIVAMAYPVLHVGAFVFGLLSVWQRTFGARRRILLVFLLAMGVLTLVTTLYGVSLLTHSYEAGDELDVLWIATFAIVVWAAYEEEWRATEAVSFVERVAELDAVVPAGAIALIVIAFAAFHEQWRPELVPIWLGCGALLATSFALREVGAHRIESTLRHEIRLEEGRFRRVFDVAPIGIARLDDRGLLLNANELFRQLAGSRTGALADDTGWELAGLAPLIRRALADGGVVHGDKPLELGDQAVRATVRAIDASEGEPAGVLVILEDVTAERKLQRDVLQGQKMQAVGTLAGGIAHDFNNLLSGMIASITLMRRRGSLDADTKQLVDHMEQSMWRAADLTQRLLSLSRKREALKTTVEPGPVVKRAAQLLSRSVDENVAVRERLSRDPITVEVDAGQLEQAILNLGINARDAMRPRGGDLTVALETEETRGERWALIRVSDTGAGIAPEIRERIFEPFFTTKDEGEGTGLGLAMVYAFARDHGGSVEVESELGRGSTFTLRLPIHGTRAPVGLDDRPLSLVPGAETVLVVDDRDTALFALKSVLSECGYRVVVASNGVEALTELERRRRTVVESENGRPPGRISLVITDAVMRRMGGRELLKAMRQRGFDVPVMLATGHDEEAHRGTDGFVAVVRKPFDPVDLSRLVRAAIDGELHVSMPPPAGEDPDPTSELPVEPR